MKILLLSFYDLGKQPKIISEIYNKINSDLVEIDFVDFSFESREVDLDKYDAIGIYAPMHTATVLATEYLSNQNLPDKIFTFGLYGDILSDIDSRIHFIESIDSNQLDKYLDLMTNDDFSFKETVPDRSILPNIKEYARLVEVDNNLLTGSVETTYGCRHLCTHCPVPIQFNGRFRTFSEEKIIQDISNQIDLGAAHISFNDPDFFNGPKHSLKILERLNNEFPLITYDSTIKVEHILKFKDYFKELNKLNMLFVTSAFETTNDLVLQILQKGHSSMDLQEAIELSKVNNIDIRPTWLPFTPWTTINDLLSIIKLIENNKLRETVDPIQLTIKLLIPKGSLITKRPEIKKYLDQYDKKSFSYSWSYMNNEVDILQKTLFSYLVENESLDEKEQYVGLVHLIEDFTGSEIIHNEEYIYRHSPKLSESWFCCSEPSNIQLDRIKSNQAVI